MNKINKFLIFIAIFSWFFLGLPQIQTVHAASQTKFVGSCASDPGPPQGTKPWKNTGNLYANDEIDSTLEAKIKHGQTTEFLVCDMTGNQFTVPTDATIDGIVVNIESEDTKDGGGEDLEIMLIKGGTKQGNNNARSAGTKWSQTEEIITWGTPTDKWGSTWLYTDVNAVNFGVSIRAHSPDNIFFWPSVDYVEIVVYYTEAATASTYEQASYRWFVNTDSTSVGRATGMSTPATAPAQGTPFRLRMLLHIGTNDLAINGTTTKLQFSERSGTCDTAFSGETYADVATASGDIRFYDNATPADGDNLTETGQDPRHASAGAASDTVSPQDYEESNNFTNSVSGITAGDDGMWDFSLVDFSAPPGTTYCFRGKGMDTYTVIPEITTRQMMKIRLRGQVRLRIVRLR